MSAEPRRPDAARTLGSLWALACLVLFLIFFVPFAALLIYNLFGLTGALVTAAIVAGVVYLVRPG